VIACAVSKAHTRGPYRICVGWGFHFCRGEEFQDNINTHLGEVIKQDGLGVAKECVLWQSDDNSLSLVPVLSQRIAACTFHHCFVKLTFIFSPRVQQCLRTGLARFPSDVLCAFLVCAVRSVAAIILWDRYDCAGLPSWLSNSFVTSAVFRYF
jgi:hypothetical protein